MLLRKYPLLDAMNEYMSTVPQALVTGVFYFIIVYVVSSYLLLVDCLTGSSDVGGGFFVLLVY